MQVKSIIAVIEFRNLHDLLRQNIAKKKKIKELREKIKI